MNVLMESTFNNRHDTHSPYLHLVVDRFGDVLLSGWPMLVFVGGLDAQLTLNIELWRLSLLEQRPTGMALLLFKNSHPFLWCPWIEEIEG